MSEVTQRYYEAVRELPPEAHKAHIERRRSKSTIKAILFADAPDDLRMRFAKRYKELTEADLASLTPREKGIVHFLKGNFSSSEKELKAALKMGDRRAHLDLGDMYRTQSGNMLDVDSKGTEEAQTHYKEALEADPTNHKILYKNAEICFGLDDDEHAFEYMEKAIAAAPDEFTKTFYSGVLCFMKNEDSQAEKLLSTVVEKGHIEAGLLLIGIFSERNKLGRARKVAERLIEFGYTQMYRPLAEIYLASDKKTAALETLQKSVDAGNVSDIALLSGLLLQVGRRDDAVAMCEASIARGEGMGHFVLASLLGSEGDEKGGIEHLKKAIPLGFQDNFFLKFILATIDKAYVNEALKICKERAVKNPKLYFFLVMLHFIKGDKDAAFKAGMLGLEKNDFGEIIKEVKRLGAEGNREAAASLLQQTVMQHLIEATPPVFRPIFEDMLQGLAPSA